MCLQAHVCTGLLRSADNLPSDGMFYIVHVGVQSLAYDTLRGGMHTSRPGPYISVLISLANNALSHQHLHQAPSEAD